MTGPTDEPSAEPTDNEMSAFLTKFYTIAPARMVFYRDVLRRWTRHYLARASVPPSAAQTYYLDAVDITQLIDAHKREMDNGDDDCAIVLSKREAGDTIVALQRLLPPTKPAATSPVEVVNRYEAAAAVDGIRQRGPHETSGVTDRPAGEEAAVEPGERCRCTMPDPHCQHCDGTGKLSDK